MSRVIVQSDKVVTLIGGGHVNQADLSELLSQPRPIVAADGGARHVVAAGQVPDAVIGDFDSLDPETKRKIPPDRLHAIPEQDTTDFEKCLSRIRAPLVVGLGFLGARLDHQLAAYHGLVRCADQSCILVGEDQCAFLCPPEFTFTTQVDALVSIYPVVPVSATSTGLYWPLDGLDLQAGATISTSNRASASSVTIRCDRPGLLIILPAQALPSVSAALSSGASRWPVRVE